MGEENERDLEEHFVIILLIRPMNALKWVKLL